MRIFNIGSCNIDTVYSVAHVAAPGETVGAAQVAVYSGGKGLNQSVAAAAAGADVFHAGCIGADGDFLSEILLRRGVNVDLLRRTKTRTGCAMIQVGGAGENAIVVYPGANALVDPPYIDEVLTHAAPGDFLLLQNETASLRYAVTRAAELGLSVVLNPSPFDETLRALPLEKVAYLILNETEAAGFADGADFFAWARAKYPALRIVLTLGEAGSVYADGETRIRQPAFPVQTVDTTAAGDTFTGYFFAALAAGKPAQAALRIASAASAIAVSRPGASASVPDAGEVRAFLAARGEEADA